MGLEPLTSITFPNASVVDPMYGKAQNWVAQAYKTVQLERDTTEWRVETGLAVIRPRLRFYDASDLGGGTFQGNAVSGETGQSFALSAPIYTKADESVGYADIIGMPTTADTLGDDITLNFALRQGENIFFPDDVAPNSVYRFFGWGEYNFLDGNDPLDTDATDIQDIHLTTMAILSDNSDDLQVQPLDYIPWSDWALGRINQPGTPTTPLAFTKNPQGRFIFNTPLDKPYRVKFSYTKKIHSLSVYNDIPEGLRTDFHEMIAWMALSQYGKFDCQPNVVQYANENYMRYKRRVERLDMPTVYFNPAVRW
jgi:hypothetical protein